MRMRVALLAIPVLRAVVVAAASAPSGAGRLHPTGGSSGRCRRDYPGDAPGEGCHHARMHVLKAAWPWLRRAWAFVPATGDPVHVVSSSITVAILAVTLAGCTASTFDTSTVIEENVSRTGAYVRVVDTSPNADYLAIAEACVDHYDTGNGATCFVYSKRYNFAKEGGECWQARARDGDSAEAQTAGILALCEVTYGTTRTATPAATRTPVARRTPPPVPTRPSTAAPAITRTPTPTSSATPTPTPSATPTPTPSATPTPARTPGATPSKIDLLLRDAGAQARLIRIDAMPDHPIGEWGLQVLVQVGDRSHRRVNTAPIAPDPELDVLSNVRVIANERWDDVSAVTAKTLDARTVRTWECIAQPTVLAEARYVCSVHSTEQMLDLSAVSEATLWVYLDHAGASVQARAGVHALGAVTVRLHADGALLARRDYSTNALGAGEVQRLDGFDGTVTSVYAVSEALGYLRCEQHRDSDDAITAWACELW